MDPSILRLPIGLGLRIVRGIVRAQYGNSKSAILANLMLKIEELARTIIEDDLGKSVAGISRFPTGLSHFVFDVVADDGFQYVVRIARPERRKEFERGIYWHKNIARLGVPLPNLFHYGELLSHHYAIYERLLGDDLENVYSLLSAQEKDDIAQKIAEIQKSISFLERKLFERVYPWVEVLRWIVDRSEQEILASGICDSAYIGIIREQIEENKSYLEILQSAAFLYDLSVRNVIIHEGKITGIIDVDDVWLGDPLLAIGRGKTILLAMRQDINFITYWCEYLKLSKQQMRMVEIYALLYCVRFMGTIGTKLNGNESIQTNPDNARLFERIAESALERITQLAP